MKFGKPSLFAQMVMVAVFLCSLTIFASASPEKILVTTGVEENPVAGQPQSKLLKNGASDKTMATAQLSRQSSLSGQTQSIFHYIIGLLADWNGSDDLAVDEYQKASSFDPDSHIIHLRLGSTLARLGKVDDAIKELKAAANLKPEEVQIHYLLALIYSSQQNFDKAAEEYEAILKQLTKNDPKNVEIYGYLGQLYYSQRKYDKAIEQFNTMLQLEPKNADVLFALGSLYLDKNDRLTAAEYYKKAIAIDPEHETSLNSLGYIYAEDGVELDMAMDLIERALKISPDNGAYIDSLAWVYYKKGMYKEALENLEKAIKLFEDPVIYEHLGDVYLKLNDNYKAVENWKRALELDPEQKGVVQKLESVQKELGKAK